MGLNVTQQTHPLHRHCHRHRCFEHCASWMYVRTVCARARTHTLLSHRHLIALRGPHLQMPARKLFAAVEVCRGAACIRGVPISRVRLSLGGALARSSPKHCQSTNACAVTFFAPSKPAAMLMVTKRSKVTSTKAAWLVCLCDNWLLSCAKEMLGTMANRGAVHSHLTFTAHGQSDHQESPTTPRLLSSQAIPFICPLAVVTRPVENS